MLYPGAAANVAVTISNPNPFPVSVDSLTLPASTVLATAYNEAALTSLDAACNTEGTGVHWTYTSKSMSGVIVAAKSGAINGSVSLTLTGGATMTNASGNSCQAGFFKMPNVLTVVGSSSTGTPVASISQ